MAVTLIGLILALVLGKQSKELGLLLTLGVCTLVSIGALAFLEPVTELLRELRDLGELDGQALSILIKCAGIAVLSELSPDQVALAAASGDHKAFTRAQGVGPKLAQRIVLEMKDKVAALNDASVEMLEQWIDSMQEALPAIDKFTIPGGDRRLSMCHVCRTVCRRAERAALRADEENGVSELARVYLNRLSDYFYALGRTIVFRAEVEEILWHP